MIVIDTIREFFPSEVNEFHFSRYVKFLESRIKRVISADVYCEKHHIVPVSLCKTLRRSKDNIILLTGREHFIAHLILWKVIGGPMTQSFFRMVNSKGQNGSRDHITSRQYEVLRNDYA
jgi:membrane protein required for beta-lactamase induction